LFFGSMRKRAAQAEEACIRNDTEHNALTAMRPC
jgi:hypothetical protein